MTSWMLELRNVVKALKNAHCERVTIGFSSRPLDIERQSEMLCVHGCVDGTITFRLVHRNYVCLFFLISSSSLYRFVRLHT